MLLQSYAKNVSQMFAEEYQLEYFKRINEQLDKSISAESHY